MANIPIYPGSSSFFPGDTPFGFYDNDVDFQRDIDKFATWSARRLGYPIVDVELQDKNFYAAFEEATSEYGQQVNTYISRDNLLYLLGASTGSVNLSQEYISPNGNAIFKLTEEYGTAAGVGGNVTFYTGSLAVLDGQQTYDLDRYAGVTLETGSFSTGSFTIRRVHHYPTPSLMRYADAYLGTGLGSSAFLGEFGWGTYVPYINFMMYPTNYDLLRIQAVEISDQVRRSAYSFQLVNNRLRIFPIPTRNTTLYFEYTLDSDEQDSLSGGTGKISDHSNVPYQNMVYERINQMGRQWIRRYALALCKEMLGYVRSKYSSIPIPGDEVTLNGDQLISAAEAEKNYLIEELRETLEEFSRSNIMQRKTDEANALQEQLNYHPLKIYFG